MQLHQNLAWNQFQRLNILICLFFKEEMYVMYFEKIDDQTQ